VKITGNRVAALIVAAGYSDRMEGEDKIFALLNEEPVLARVIAVFQSCPSIDEIVIVLAEKSLEKGRMLAAGYSWAKVVAICRGGLRRQDSVKEGLKHIKDCDWVVIHDGARPCISVDLIEQGLIYARETGAAIAAVPVTDTVKIVSDNHLVEDTPSRRNMWAAQTPQVFRYSLISAAHSQYNNEVTDDAALLEQTGHKIKVYMGSYQNIKITSPDDLAAASVFLRNRER